MNYIIIEKLSHLGFIIKNNLREGGIINRVATVYQPNKKNGWVKINNKTVVFGDWSNHIEKGYFWIEENSSFMDRDLERRVIEEDIRRREAEENKTKACVLALNKEYLSCSENFNTHPYLERKQAKIYPYVKLDKQNRLVIPMFDVNNSLVGCQTIDKDGKKLFKIGSVCRGSFFPIKSDCLGFKSLDVIFLVEGYATGSSVYQALFEDYIYSYGVLVCFSAHNIDLVRQAIFNKYGITNIIAIKDQDYAGMNCKTRGFSVGITTGEDANDIHLKFGLEKLNYLIMENLKYI